jgi:hypothetical protein
MMAERMGIRAADIAAVIVAIIADKRTADYV